ncbi:hypothetical protein SPAN111604_14870 [Sphingomonas antarctica]|uniref:PEPxxWA-CTERM sorting domain-containing protein n=1 Tax=Sphingomonas antarctica TaxID=2040274 RepID=UPI0039E76C06
MFKTMIIAAAVFAVPATAATNLIGNGGFESPGAPNGGYLQGFGGNTDGFWTVTGNDVLVLNTNYVENGITFNAFEGSNALDITGSGNTGPADGLYQDVATVAGRSYNLSFALGNGSDAPQGATYLLPSSIGLTIGGGVAQNFTNAAISPNGINWAIQNYRFTATGSTTRVAFTNNTPGGDNYAGLDAVSLTAVPEPASWALMLGGFGLMGGAMRRRRSNVIFA